MRILPPKHVAARPRVSEATLLAVDDRVFTAKIAGALLIGLAVRLLTASEGLRRRVAWSATALVLGGGILSSLALPSVCGAGSTDNFDAEVARRYAAVAGWQGFWEATETRGASKSGAAGFKRTAYEAVSHGRFELARDDHGRAPAEGDFTWTGSGEVSGTTSESMSSWSKSGPRMVGEDWQVTGGGRASTRRVAFTIWMRRQFVSLHAGAGTGDVAPTHKVGRAVRQLSSADGQHHYEEVAIDETWSASLMEFFLPNYEKETKHWMVVQGGPGVLTFVHEERHHPSVGGSKRSRVVMAPIYDDVEVAVTIGGYEKWLPRGSIAKPSSPGNHLVVRATLVPKDGRARELPKVRDFRFELSETSSEPGVCLNWPLDAEDAALDLRLATAPSFPGELSAQDQKIAVAGTLPDEDGRPYAETQVDSYDFGGHATLRVFCVLEDGREILGILEQQGDGLAMIPLPWRRSGSKIAKVWAERVGLAGSDGEDLDDRPLGDGNKGDGFSNYEEYRGFVQAGDHVRTKPGQKDLFIRNTLGARALPGIFRYTDITGLAVHYELRQAELPASRRLNSNRSADSPHSCADDQFQHGLILDRIVGGDASITDIEGDLWRPEFVSSVRILEELFDPGNEEQLASTIAHELLHATGVRHHGDMDDYVVWLQKSREVNGRVEHWFEERPAHFDEDAGNFVFPSTPGAHIRIFIDPENEVAADSPFLPKPQIMFLGHYWQQHSGDVNCVMRYHCAQAFVVPTRPRDRFLSPGEPIAAGICASTAGTDFNAPQPPGQKFPRYSAASRGDCMHSFCVRDDAPEKTTPP